VGCLDFATAVKVLTCFSSASFSSFKLMNRFQPTGYHQHLLFCSGTETLVRFNNYINNTGEAAASPWQVGYWPCNQRLGKPRDGRPLSTHCHGMKSLPPFDGWADDIICSGESKDYIYPNSNPVLAWYHDHAFAQTGPNVWAGKVRVQNKSVFHGSFTLALDGWLLANYT
jgi:hypothetical protein